MNDVPYAAWVVLAERMRMATWILFEYCLQVAHQHHSHEVSFILVDIYLVKFFCTRAMTLCQCQ